jgi:hypothetical protein
LLSSESCNLNEFNAHRFPSPIRFKHFPRDSVSDRFSIIPLIVLSLVVSVSQYSLGKHISSSEKKKCGNNYLKYINNKNKSDSNNNFYYYYNDDNDNNNEYDINDYYNNNNNSFK